MSFSKDVKTELTHGKIEKDCCCWAEIVAFMLLCGEVRGSIGSGWKMEITTDHPAVARRIYRLLKQSGQRKPQVWIINGDNRVKNRLFKVNTYLQEETFEMIHMLLLRKENGDFFPEVYQMFQKNCCRRAFLRVAFICRGFVAPPEKSYHLEMLFQNKDIARLVGYIMKEMQIEGKMTQRRNAFPIYLKECERVCQFLKLIGATRAALQYENMRIYRSVKNGVNRQVNCETANLEKTVAAAVRQKELIERVIEKWGIQIFPSNYQELARLRMDFSENTLQELGSMLDPPLSKSGVAYRMRRIEAFAKAKLEG